MINDNVMTIFINAYMSEVQMGNWPTSYFPLIASSHSTLYRFPHSHMSAYLTNKAEELISFFFTEVKDIGPDLLEPSHQTPQCVEEVRWGRGPLLFYTQPNDVPEMWLFFHPSSYSNIMDHGWNKTHQSSSHFPACQLSSVKSESEIQNHYFGAAIAFQSFVLLRYNISFHRRGTVSSNILSAIPKPWQRFNIELLLSAVNSLRRKPHILYIQRGKQERSLSGFNLIRDQFKNEYDVKIVTCCHWSELSQRDFVALVHSMDIVLGVHGAGMSGMIYMSPGGMVVEIMHSMNTILFPTMSRHLVHKHVPINAPSQSGPEGYIVTESYAISTAKTVMEAWTAWTL